MNARVIGATLFVLSFVLFLFSPYYSVMYSFLAFVGIFEGISMYQNNRDADIYAVLMYICIFIFSLYCMNYITIFSPGLMLYIACIIMFGDTFAYITGKKHGKTKLSHISPNKTVEGAIGGIVFGIMAANILLYVLAVINLQQFLIFDFSTIVNYHLSLDINELLLVSIVISILSIFGDLTESYIKRLYQVKDSGSIIYGHGGILDRMDSWVFTSIFVYLIFQVI